MLIEYHVGSDSYRRSNSKIKSKFHLEISEKTFLQLSRIGSDNELEIPCLNLHSDQLEQALIAFDNAVLAHEFRINKNV